MSVYYILTTLSTVGYGDYYPVSILEKIIGSILMFCGVTFFSIMMNGFVDIVLSLADDDSAKEQEKSLRKWFVLLSRFNNNQEVDKELKTNIKRHFQYFWKNNRSQTLVD